MAGKEFIERLHGIFVIFKYIFPIFCLKKKTKKNTNGKYNCERSIISVSTVSVHV